MPRKWEAFILLKQVLFQDAFCSLCHGRMWVDLFLQVCTRESASDLQIAFIIRRIVHWWIMCGLQRRYAAFKIAHLFCKPQPQRQAVPSEVASGSKGFCVFSPDSWGHWFCPLVHRVFPWRAETLKHGHSLSSWRRHETGREFWSHC